MKDNVFYLRAANEEAKKARATGNTPFGAVLEIGRRTRLNSSH